MGQISALQLQIFEMQSVQEKNQRMSSIMPPLKVFDHFEMSFFENGLPGLGFGLGSRS